MFRCGVCAGNSRSGEKATKVVTHTRACTHPETGKSGRQTVREILAHAECAPVAGATTEVAQEATKVVSQ